MLQLGYHEDDGQESSYWFIYDDAISSGDHILECFDTKTDALKSPIWDYDKYL